MATLVAHLVRSLPPGHRFDSDRRLQLDSRVRTLAFEPVDRVVDGLGSIGLCPTLAQLRLGEPFEQITEHRCVIIADPGHKRRLLAVDGAGELAVQGPAAGRRKDQHAPAVSEVPPAVDRLTSTSRSMTRVKVAAGSITSRAMSLIVCPAPSERRD